MIYYFFSVVDEDGDSDADAGNDGDHVEVDEDDDADADADSDADDADDAQDDEDDETDDDTAVDEAEEMPELSKRYVRAVKNLIRSFKTKLPWSKVRNPLLNFKCQKRVFVRKKSMEMIASGVVLESVSMREFNHLICQICMKLFLIVAG